DKTQRPNRLYIGDTNHNRVLGFDHLGTCSNSSAACTNDTDCSGGTCVLTPAHLCAGTSTACLDDSSCSGGARCVPNPGSLTAQNALGQVAAVDAAACNFDGTGQLSPARAPAAANSLCLLDPLQIGIRETVYATLMDVDSAGNLFVPDLFNNRVLR